MIVMIGKTRTAIPGSFLFFTVILILNSGFLSANPDSILSMNNLAGLSIGRVSKKELNKLNNGELILNLLDSYRSIRLQPESVKTEAIVERYKKLRPNFLAEAMFVMPVGVGKEQEMLRKLLSLLQSVRNFGKIPYYSKHNGTWNPLFEDITIKKNLVFPDGSDEIITEQKMRPFNLYTAVYSYRISEGSLLYETYNRTPLYYKGLKSVRNEGMYTSFLVRAYSGYLFFMVWGDQVHSTSLDYLETGWI